MNHYFTQIFLSMIQIGYQASITVFFVILARIFLNLIHIPKRYSYFLWLIPFIRLALPIQPQSIFSLLPDSTKPVSIDIPLINQPVIYIDSNMINHTLYQTLPATLSESNRNPLHFGIVVMAILWVVGVCVLLVYSTCSILQLKRKLCISVQQAEHIYLADNIPTAFVMGIRPARIYLPSNLSDSVIQYVICHEQQHIKRKDHIVKIILFLFTCFYWMHPLIWIAYYLANKDIEFACDEAVIYAKPFWYRQKYAAALLTLSIYHKKFLTIPLSFSERSPKKRIQHIIAYKKPMLFVMICGIIVMILLSFSLLTNPIKNTTDESENASIFNQNTTNQNFTNQDSATQQREEQADQVEQMEQAKQAISQQITQEIEPITEPQEKAETNHTAESQTKPETNQQAEQLTGQTERTAKPTLELKTPQIDLSATTGADDPRLYYVDEHIIIFGGYFGLFVYSKTEQTIIRGIDLEEIGCSATQGDHYSEIWVSSDGTTIYLHPVATSSDGTTTRIHPLLSEQTFIYQISEHTLQVKQNYQIERTQLYNGVSEDGFRGSYQVDGEERICTIQHSGVIGSISWSEDSEIYHNFFPEES